MRFSSRRSSVERRLDEPTRPAPHREQGASAIDYGLLMAGIVILVLVVVLALGHDIVSLFT